MKDLTKVFIDLSKLSEEEVRMLNKVINIDINQISEFPLLFCFETKWDQAKKGDKFHIYGKSELTYPEFIKLFEGGEGETQIENIKDIAHTEGVLVGLRICKQLWAQGTISHETIQEEIYHYQEELENLNSK